VADELEALSVLADPGRRRLYAFAVEAGRPIGREEAAAAAGIGRSLAAYHLDRLAGVGLLEVEYARPAGRTGPGAGRPAKLYRRAERELAFRVPPRDYRVLAELAVEAASADAAVCEALERAASELGERAGAAGSRLVDVLLERGYEPFDREAGQLGLRNCPFAAVAARCPEVVCRINLALVRGILAGLRLEPARAVLTPDAAGCCVSVLPA